MRNMKPSQFSIIRRELEDSTVVYILVNKKTQEEVGFFASREEANAFIFSR